MKCYGCPANKFAGGKLGCLAGIVPHIQRKSGEFGCCCNRAQIAKYMRECADKPKKEG